MTASDKEFEDIVKVSGHNFHARVVSTLRALEWTAVVSPYYSDNFTDKPRELDIIAERTFKKTYGRTSTDHYVEVRLFVECKFVNKPTVIWFDTKDQQKAFERVRLDGFDSPVLGNDFQHHYKPQKPVGKLFASQGRGDEADPFGRAINQNLNALIYYRRRPLVGLQPKRDTIAALCYPLIVVDAFDNLRQINFADSQKMTPVADNFQLEVNYAYVDHARSPRDEYFLIDVVSIDRLAAFLADLVATDVNSRWAHWTRSQG
jgi:hypothetical protein